MAKDAPANAPKGAPVAPVAPPPTNAPTPPATPPNDPPASASETRYASAEEFRQFQQSVDAGFNRVLSMLNRTGSVAAPTAPPAIEDVLDDDLDNAIAEGKGASKLVRKAIGAAVDRVRRGEIDSIRSTGFGAIGKLVRHIATREMKFYDRYKREIDAAIAELPPESQLDPDLLIAIHNTIAGRPENIQRMIDEARQSALREATDEGSADAGGTGTRRSDPASRTPPVPSPRELLGEAAADALDAAGRTPDRFAQGLGYRDWSHYVDEYKKGTEGAAGGTA